MIYGWILRPILGRLFRRRFTGRVWRGLREGGRTGAHVTGLAGGRAQGFVREPRCEAATQAHSHAEGARRDFLRLL